MPPRNIGYEASATQGMKDTVDLVNGNDVSHGAGRPHSREWRHQGIFPWASGAGSGYGVEGRRHSSNNSLACSP